MQRHFCPPARVVSRLERACSSMSAPAPVKGAAEGLEPLQAQIQRL